MYMYIPHEIKSDDLFGDQGHKSKKKKKQSSPGGGGEGGEIGRSCSQFLCYMVALADFLFLYSKC